jgi:hypothetical protein
VAPWVNRHAYPFRWFHSVLNAADCVRRAALLDGTPPDPRMAEAIAMIRAARQPDRTCRPEADTQRICVLRPKYVVCPL